MRKAACVALAATALVLLGAGPGCGDPERPPVGGNPAHETSSRDASVAEAAAPTPSRLCGTLTRSGDVVWELHLAGDPPTPMGGALVAGTYELAELYAFGDASRPVPPPDTDAGSDTEATADGGEVDDGGADAGEEGADSGEPTAGDETPRPSPVTGNTLQSTIIVTHDTVRRAELRGRVDSTESRELRAVSFFESKETVLVMKSVCPTVGAEARVSYTAVEGGLLLFADPNHVEIYARRP